MTHEEAIDKVRKLLALSESDNEHESAAAMGHAQAIMEKYRIDAAILATEEGEEREPIQQWEDPLEHNSNAVWRAVLASILAKANGCSIFKNRKTVVIVGTATSAGTVRYLYAYCVAEVERLASLNKGNGRTWLNNYRHGCVDAISTAINRERDALRSKMRADAGSAVMVIDNALALIDQDSTDARNYAASKNKLRTTSASSRANAEARAAGQRDGANIYPGSGSRTALGVGTKRISK